MNVDRGDGTMEQHCRVVVGETERGDGGDVRSDVAETSRRGSETAQEDVRAGTVQRMRRIYKVQQSTERQDAAHSRVNVTARQRRAVAREQNVACASSPYAGEKGEQQVLQGLPFAVKIKPRQPPTFSGRVEEDVVTWTMQVRNYLSLTISSDEQQVAYMSTLLQGAAIDWWVALLQERGGRRPRHFEELAALLEQRFGSTNRVLRARASLRSIQQEHFEGVRNYAIRFEELLGKLPNIDEEWAKSQFVWGLRGEIAAMVVIAAPTTLASAIEIAERVEMARNATNLGDAQKQSKDVKRRQGNARELQDDDGGSRIGRSAVAQCRKCRGFGHWAYQCPSYHFQRGCRGGRRGRKRSNRGVQAVNEQPVANAALAQSEPEMSWGVLQPTPSIPAVSLGGLQGN